MTDYEAYRPYTISREQDAALDAVRDNPTVQAAADALGRNIRNLYSMLARIKKQAAKKGVGPDLNHPTPEGFAVKGVSTLYDGDGVVRAQWVKTREDGDPLEALKEAAEAMRENIPRLPALPAPKASLEALATVYTITDAHVGMLAWHEEGGQDWDLKIAEKTLIGCYEAMAAGSPDSAIGVVAQLGDFLHSDSLTPVTPTSGHILDADGRYSKVVRVAIKVLRRMVDVALQKHSFVLVLMKEGNHDMVSSIWLRTLFSALYENEPRVQVVNSPLPYYAYQHGKTMLAWHHGHLKKNDQLPLLFAAQFPQIWGATSHRYAHTGHRHHVEEKEHSGMTVVQHPTLAARDAYAARGGWIADRAASAITYHKEWGQVGRVTVTPEMVG